MSSILFSAQKIANRSLLTGIQLGHLIGMVPAWRGFKSAARNPEKIQNILLKRLMRANADTVYGTRYHFDKINSLTDYQKSVPIVDYEEVLPWIDRVANGEQQVLTYEPVTMMERSSGSTSVNKLIPYTAGLLAEFSAATGAWLTDLYLNRPGFLGTRSYWSVSPVVRNQEATPGGLPIGFDDDTEYFGSLTRWALRRMMAVSGDVAKYSSIDDWRQATLIGLLSADDLGLISVWSPTFLLELIKILESELDSFLVKLPRIRAEQIKKSLDREGRLTGDVLWPRLDIISCWTQSASAGFLPALQKWFPNVWIQGKGLLATEGVVSFPLCGASGSVLALSSHVLEFIDLDHPDRLPVPGYALRPGGCYSPLISTSGGLYRYQLKDRISCVGRYQKIPLVNFEGKLDNVSDLCGEKLNGIVVERAILSVQKALGQSFLFSMLAPVISSDRVPGYCLFMEPQASLESSLVRRLLEEHLLQCYHYRYCRELGQLGPLTVRIVYKAWPRYEQALLKSGKRLGEIKPVYLDQRLNWSAVFDDVE